MRCPMVKVMLTLLIVTAMDPCCALRRRGPGDKGCAWGGRRCFKPGIPIIRSTRPTTPVYYEHEDRAKIVSSSYFELEYILGRKITFFCMAQGYPRPEITWFKDGIELYHHRFFQVHEWQLSNDTTKSKMEIDPTTPRDAGYYECQADNQYSVDRRRFRTNYIILYNH